LGGHRDEIPLPFGEPLDFGPARATLLPAGHILGSAQVFVETANGTALVSGDFKRRPGRAAEPIAIRPAETLVMETTFGRPQFVFPPEAEVAAAVTAFCHQAFADGATPVLLGYSLGKAQEILCLLDAAGIPPMLHPAAFAISEIYRDHLPGFPSNFQRFTPGATGGHALVFPPQAARSKALAEIPNPRTALLSGWAIDPSARFRCGADAAFPLSDHAGYDDLLRYVEAVNPTRVFTMHGFADAFARDLRARGLEAWPLSGATQLDLPLAP
jgi:Cft2 family RNA processing exonuclease